MRLVLIALVGALGLSGCYVSKRPLLDERQAVRALAEGVFVDPENSGDILDISAEPDGWYRIYEVGDDEAERVLFTALPWTDGVMAVAWSDSDGRGRIKGYIYGLARRGDDGLVHLGGASCDNASARQAALAHGAKLTVSSGSSEAARYATCEFRGRAAVTGALADYAKSWNWREATTKLPAR